MIVAAVDVRVKPERVRDFIEAVTRNHEGSVREEGCLRFDVLRSRADPTRFLLYEVYDSEAAAAAHKNTPHYLAWRDAVAEMMASPREGTAYDVVAPKGREAW